MKVAVLISGLLRTYKKSFPTFKKFVIDENPHISFDFYLSPWDLTHTRADRVQEKTSLSDKDFEDLVHTYTPKKINVLEYEKHRADILNDTQNKGIYEILKKRIPSYGENFIWNSHFMAHQGMLLNYQHFVDSGGLDEGYDLIMKTRFDLNYSKVLSGNIDPDIINCCKPVGGQMLNNLIAISKPELMEKYFQTYSSLTSEGWVLKNTNVYFPECLVREHLNVNGVKYDHSIDPCTIIR